MRTLGTDHTWAAPSLPVRAAGSPPAAARLAPRGGTDASGGGQGGRQAGREGIALLNAYSGAGGWHRRAVHARGEPESAALPPLSLPAGDPRAPPRRARHGAARPLPAPLRPQRVGGLGARGGGRRPPPPPLRRRGAQAAPRVPPLAPQEEGAASPGGRRCPDRAARLAPRVPGPAVSATAGGGDRRAGHGWGRGFFCRGGKSVSRSRLPCRVRPSLLAEPCWQTAAPVWISNSQPCARSRGRLPGPNQPPECGCRVSMAFTLLSSGLVLCSLFLDVVEEEDEREGLDDTLLQCSP